MNMHGISGFKLAAGAKERRTATNIPSQSDSKAAVDEWLWPFRHNLNDRHARLIARRNIHGTEVTKLKVGKLLKVKNSFFCSACIPSNADSFFSVEFYPSGTLPAIFSTLPSPVQTARIALLAADAFFAVVVSAVSSSAHSYSPEAVLASAQPVTTSEPQEISLLPM